MNHRRLPVTGLLCVLAVVVCAAVNTGNFGTIDTGFRLQAERWMRLGEPPVRAEDIAAGFGIRGRNGVVQPWYGMGQSLVLMPFDVVAGIAVSPFKLDANRRRQVTELLIAFLMQSVLTILLALLARALLASFGFSPLAAAAGALSLLLATTCLAYVQVAQENELLLVLALGALWAIRRWESAGDIRWAALAGAASGFALLVRLPSIFEAVLFGAFALSSGGDRKKFLAGWLPPLLCAVLIDRWYQWLRFGEWFSTYTGILGRQARAAGAPSSYPFTYPFSKGFFGSLFSGDKSIFLFDPLLLVVIGIVIWRWSSLERRLRAALIALAVLLFLYVTLHARWYGFGGDVAWGHRFLTLPVQSLALFAVPLLLRTGPSMARAARWICWGVVFLSISEQASSTTILHAVEVAQRDQGVGHTVLWNRVVNFTEVVRGDTSGPRFAMLPKPWRTFAYFPYQLRFQFPDLAVWAIAGWWFLVASIPVLVCAVWRRSAQES